MTSIAVQITFLLFSGGGFGALDANDAGTRAEGAGSARSIRYQVTAGAPRLNRKITGPVVQYVQGVPAEPVNSMVYDGDGSTPIDGQLVLEVDPIRNTGFIQASWTDKHGDWVYVQSRFIHPEHLSGVRLSASVEHVEEIINEGIVHNVYLHGDTRAGMPMLPTLFNYLATWGPTDVTLNGQPFQNPFGIPAPQWIGHLMVSEGVRQPDGTVRNGSGGIYSPMEPTNGFVEPGDLEVHLVFHDERFPLTTSMPNLFSFFYHLVFEDVSIRILQAETPLARPAPLQRLPRDGVSAIR
jgi:hypothetical protein